MKNDTISNFAEKLKKSLNYEAIKTERLSGINGREKEINNILPILVRSNKSKFDFTYEEICIECKKSKYSFLLKGKYAGRYMGGGHFDGKKFENCEEQILLYVGTDREGKVTFIGIMPMNTFLELQINSEYDKDVCWDYAEIQHHIEAGKKWSKTQTKMGTSAIRQLFHENYSRNDVFIIYRDLASHDEKEENY